VCIASRDCKSAFSCNYLGLLEIGAIEIDVLTDIALRDRQCKGNGRVQLYLDNGNTDPRRFGPGNVTKLVSYVTESVRSYRGGAPGQLTGPSGFVMGRIREHSFPISGSVVHKSMRRTESNIL
jgi:hypothetical protein